MKLLFITRKYPPMIGGMEKMSHALAAEFSKQVDTTLITWGRSQKYLPYFLLAAFIKSLIYIPTRKIDHIHLGDGLLAPLGLLLKTLFNIRTTVTIAGLDITYKLPIYQFIVPKCVARLDKVVCISSATMQECINRKVPADKCVVIPCGVYPEEFTVQAQRQDLEKIAGINLNNKRVIITVGRLVKRKGVCWFVENVMPDLDKNIIYLIIGNGPERESIENTVASLNLNDRVRALGKVSDTDLKVIYNTADLFVMPNIPVKGDMEGFGIVAIEAGAAGLPIIAADLEGIKDAIIDNVTGKLVESKNTLSFKEQIAGFTNSRKTISDCVRKNYSWSVIGSNYISQIR